MCDNRGPKLIAWFALIILMFALIGCGYVTIWTQIRSYSGDGVIHNSSIILSPGYCIDFPKFDPARPYAATFRLSQVPQIGNTPATIYLRFQAKDDLLKTLKTRDPTTATFRIELSTAQGKILHSADFVVADSGWTGGRDGLVGVYDMKKSELPLERNIDYILDVSYTPGQVPLRTDKVFFSVENGGHI